MEADEIIKGLHNMGNIVADKLGIEQAKECLHMIDIATEMIQEREELGEELNNAVELIRKKNKRLKEQVQETNFICNLLGGEPYEVYCEKCRVMICRLGKGDDMNTVKNFFKYCPNCGRRNKE